VGAALAAYYLYNKKPRTIAKQGDGMQGAYLGPSFDHQDTIDRLTAKGARFVVLKDEEEVAKKTAEILANQKAIGWFQGRAEFGPRALGNRSILADPTCTHMQKTLNLKVKYRESFRPFAPSILAEDLEDWFSLDTESPYMLLVANISEKRKINLTAEQDKLFGIEKLNLIRSEIPAVTHVDYSARIQTVSKETNPIYHKLLTEFKKITGCPILVNTSFNIRGEPIVNTPEDAFRCFMNTELDFLIVGRCLLDKREQDMSLKEDYQDQFELD
jgi:carbamoyltransferase